MLVASCPLPTSTTFVHIRFLTIFEICHILLDQKSPVRHFLPKLAHTLSYISRDPHLLDCVPRDARNNASQTPYILGHKVIIFNGLTGFSWEQSNHKLLLKKNPHCFHKANHSMFSQMPGLKHGEIKADFVRVQSFI